MRKELKKTIFYETKHTLEKAVRFKCGQQASLNLTPCVEFTRELLVDLAVTAIPECDCKTKERSSRRAGNVKWSVSLVVQFQSKACVVAKVVNPRAVQWKRFIGVQERLVSPPNLDYLRKYIGLLSVIGVRGKSYTDRLRKWGASVLGGARRMFYKSLSMMNMEQIDWRGVIKTENVSYAVGHVKRLRLIKQLLKCSRRAYTA